MGPTSDECESQVDKILTKDFIRRAYLFLILCAIFIDGWMGSVYGLKGCIVISTEYDHENSTVVLQPEFLTAKSNVSAREGEMATLPCAVRNLGTKQVSSSVLSCLA